jgi:peptide/nickel transport system substrate-binding protein
VVETEEIGRHGGTLRTVCNNPEWNSDVANASTVPILATPVKTLSPGVYQGDVVEKCVVSPDSKTFTFHMREGMKWSDGHPLTTEDVLFGYEDVLLSDKLTPVFPQMLTAGGEPMKLEVVDDYTFKIIFEVPNGGFPYHLAGVLSTYYKLPFYPKHYLMQFHPRYAPDGELAAKLKEEGIAEGEWWTLFTRKNASSWAIVGSQGIGFPTLDVWHTVSATPNRVILERNPYFHRVDENGNQLPYIDTIESNLINSSEMAVMKVLAGEVDFLRELGAELANIPIYRENEEKGGYRTMLYAGAVAPIAVVNQSHADPVWRQVVNDVRFREALNMAIDRKEILSNVFLDLAGSTRIVSDEYDPAKSKRLLDEMGLDKTDKDGWRLAPDGKRLEIPINIVQLAGWESAISEILMANWKDIGVYTTMKVIEFGLWKNMGLSNEIQASVHWAESEPYWRRNPVYFKGYIPNQFRSWGPAFRQWFDTNGSEGEEPPAEIKRIFELTTTIDTTTSDEERMQAVDEIMASTRENTFYMDILVPSHAIIVSADLGNVPPGSQEIDSMIPIKMVDQFFFRK